MKEGIFVLGRTIKNPKPDRRTRDRWIYATEWRKGMNVVVRRAQHLERDDAPNTHYFEVRSIDETYAESVTFIEQRDEARVIGMFDDPEQCAALIDFVDSLVPSTTTEDALLWLFYKRHSSPRQAGWYALRRLVLDGKVSVADVEAAIEADERDDEKIADNADELKSIRKAGAS